MKNGNTNFVLFAVIAAVILFGWPLLQDRFFPPANPPATKIVDGKSKPVAAPAADPAVTPRDLKTVLADGPRIRIDTPALQGSINLRGARIDDLVLTRYKETVAKNSPPIRLFSPGGTQDAYFAGFGWRGDGLAPPAPDTMWIASAPVLTPTQPVTLTASNVQGQRFAIRIAIDNDYLFTVQQTVVNGGRGAVPVAAYGLINRVGVSKDPDSWTIHTGPMSVNNDAAHYNPNFKDLNTTPSSFTTTGGWLGFTDKYWLAALVPDQSRAFDGQFRASANQAYQADFTTTPQLVPVGHQLTQTAKLFAGAKEVKLLDHYTDIGAVTKLDYALDWGWFRLLEKPIFYYLDWLFRMVGNFGVAIILLTVTIRGLLFPIAQRQYRSAASVRALQPKIQALRDRYKEDKTRLQQEMNSLYKSEKVNPLAGCLPALLQIPIFYALYKVLLLTIEMRHQPFMLWIRDLSAPDPLTPINLFGFLPFNPPGFLHIGVLAILLGITMAIQSRFNPPQPDPTAQQMMGLMPWIMMFIFAPFAAGLQLYYVVSNLIAIAQQWVLNPSGQLHQKPASNESSALVR